MASEGSTDRHLEAQRHEFEQTFQAGSRAHVVSTDPRVRYIVEWRVREAVRVLTAEWERIAPGADIRSESVLVLCSGEGSEGSILLDLGFRDVTVSDISESGCRAAVERDPRLRAVVLDAERADVPDQSFGIVVVQDGLHHLSSPVAGFLESLRIARHAAVFLEPHDSLAGRRLGQKWERNGAAVNWVFRWNRDFVGQVASSYLGPIGFTDLSFSFWHHNELMGKWSNRLGRFGLPALRAMKAALSPLNRFGNQFCGLIVLPRSETDAPTTVD